MDAGLGDLLARRAAFGMRLGLERMAHLLELLDDPQRRLRAIHVVGTNGKTSTTLFSAAILAAHGLRVGAYLSPHVHGFSERVQLDGLPLPETELAAAVRAVERAAVVVDAASDEPLTQFEVLTAAAFLALATAGVDAVAVEAGLGGRYDATNVLAAPVVALTNVALDHVAQLGATRALIAAEKLAVVPPGAALVVGDADDELRDLVRALAPQAGSVTLLTGAPDMAGAPQLAAHGRFQRANLALALAASERFLGPVFDRELAGAAAARVVVPGRLQRVACDPLVIVDGAHNPHAALALAADLAVASEGRRPLVAVLAILADKDAEGVVAALAPALDAVVATRSSSPRALEPAALAAIAAAHGLVSTAIEPPLAALADARRRAGKAGAVLVCGSLSLLEDLAAIVPGVEAR